MYWHFCYDRFLGDSVNNAVALIVSLMSDQELHVDQGYTTLTGSVRLKSITNHLSIVVTSLLALSRVGGGNVFHGRAIRRAIITTSREASPVSNGLPHLSRLIRQFVSPMTSVITDCPSVRRLELVQGIGMLRGGCHRGPNARSSADGWLSPELNNKSDKDHLLFLGRYQQGSCKIFEGERERERERERELYLRAVANTNVPYICGNAQQLLKQQKVVKHQLTAIKFL